ncbi:hypothetical protein GCM10010271_62660 [Streptomyces kurssanovii]|nr:hypothetical protein GCM10010271_62660 [Streptomyces kurssanovii]
MGCATGWSSPASAAPVNAAISAYRPSAVAVPMAPASPVRNDVCAESVRIMTVTAPTGMAIPKPASAPEIKMSFTTSPVVGALRLRRSNCRAERPVKAISDPRDEVDGPRNRRRSRGRRTPGTGARRRAGLIAGAPPRGAAIVLLVPGPGSEPCPAEQCWFVEKKTNRR